MNAAVVTLFKRFVTRGLQDQRLTPQNTSTLVPFTTV